MKERFTDLAWTEGDFNKATTSPSQTALSNWMWYNKYQKNHLSVLKLVHLSMIGFKIY